MALAPLRSGRYGSYSSFSCHPFAVFKINFHNQFHLSRGLPIQTEFDAERVRGLVELQARQDALPEPGEPGRREEQAEIVRGRLELQARARWAAGGG